MTFAVVFSGSLFGPALLPAAPVVCTGFPPPCCTPLFIFSHIVGLCIHVACRVEACLPVPCGTGSHARVWGARQRPVFDYLVCGYLLGCSPVPPRGFDFLIACLDRVRVHAPLVGGCAVGLMGGGCARCVCTCVVDVVSRVGVVCRWCPPPPSKPISCNG